MVLDLNLYGSFSILFYNIHYVTFIGFLAILLVYLYRVRNLQGSILFRLLIPVLYVFGAMMHYEIFWNYTWMFYRSYAILDFVGFLLCEVMIIYTINYLMSVKYKQGIPRVNMNRWILVSLAMIPLMVWLNSTGFYASWDLFDSGLSNLDPHNFAWAVGKIVSLGYS